MAGRGFGSRIWENVKSVRFGRDGGIEAPVRANGRDGIVVGKDAIARSQRRAASATEPEANAED